MTIALKQLVAFLDEYLESNKVKDYCPNGLQVEGKNEVKKIIGGVTASQALIDAAVLENADAILVHHGYFWKGEGEAITGIKKKRIQTLLANDISLIAYHLPLDMHSEVGNNIQLAKALDVEVTGRLEPDNPRSVGLQGVLRSPMRADQFAQLVTKVMGRQCVHIGRSSDMISRLGFCTGAAQGMIEHAINQGLDGYLSGEISEPTVHLARETRVNYFSAGHHATEKGGVQALGNFLAKKFSIEFKFVDIDNPV